MLQKSQNTFFCVRDSNREATVARIPIKINQFAFEISPNPSPQYVYSPMPKQFLHEAQQ
jgi:hypothetical protein